MKKTESPPIEAEINIWNTSIEWARHHVKLNDIRLADLALVTGENKSQASRFLSGNRGEAPFYSTNPILFVLGFRYFLRSPLDGKLYPNLDASNQRDQIDSRLTEYNDDWYTIAEDWTTDFIRLSAAFARVQRERLGHSKTCLAQKLGCRSSSIIDFEEGRRMAIKSSELFRILQTLGLEYTVEFRDEWCFRKASPRLRELGKVYHMPFNLTFDPSKTDTTVLVIPRKSDAKTRRVARSTVEHNN